MNKRTRRIVLAVIASMIAVGAVRLYQASRPQVRILRQTIDQDARFPGGDYHYQRIMTVLSTSSLIPVPSDLADGLRELSDWCDGIDTDLRTNYAAPLRIEVDGSVENGTTTFRYDGYATIPDGGTVPYHEEKTFDCVFVPGKELFR